MSQRPEPGVDALRVRSVVIPPDQLHWRFSRSSGPGGQGVNTTDSRVELRFDVERSPVLSEFMRKRALRRLAGRLVDGCVTVTAQEHRSQLRNREAALDRLESVLDAALAPEPKPRRSTKPSASAVERRLREKRARSRTKSDRRAPANE